MKNLTQLNHKERQELFDINITKGNSKQLFNLLKAVLKTDNREMFGNFCVRAMVHSDKEDFANDPDSLERVLVSDGWVAYENQTTEQNIRELFVDREADLEYYFGDFVDKVRELV